MGSNAMGSNAETDYIAQLNPMEQKILQIARSHLETSFSLNKSIGFQEWQAKQEQKEQEQKEQEQKEPKIQQQVEQTQAPEKKLIKRKIKIISKPS